MDNNITGIIRPSGELPPARPSYYWRIVEALAPIIHEKYTKDGRVKDLVTDYNNDIITYDLRPLGIKGKDLKFKFKLEWEVYE